MSTKINGNALVAVKALVTGKDGKAISNTTQIEMAVKKVLIAAFESVPAQSDATATVAAIVTALKTIPDPT